MMLMSQPRRVRPLWLAIGIGFCLACGPALRAETAVRLERLDFARSGDVYTARSANLVFTLENPDSEEKPSVFDSALAIAAAGGSACKTKEMLFEKVLFDPMQPLIVGVGYSGSATIIAFFTPRCDEPYPELRFFGGDVQVEGNRIAVAPACARVNKSERKCSAGRVYELKAGQAPAYSQAQSLALTAERLGVRFEGEKVLRK
jgi:hypothetical protein